MEVQDYDKLEMGQEVEITCRCCGEKMTLLDKRRGRPMGNNPSDRYYITDLLECEKCGRTVPVDLVTPPSVNPLFDAVYNAPVNVA